MRVIVAITGASGSIYARLTIEALLRAPEVEDIALIFSDTAREVVAFEGVEIPHDERITIYNNHDLFAPVASGSASYDAMVVVPSSVGTLGRIAHGFSQTLIERAADVMLKERRRLILVVREAPYSLIHLRNMTSVTEAGGIIVPASPSFYSHPTTIEQACLTVVERIIALLGIRQPHYEWQGDKGEN